MLTEGVRACRYWHIVLTPALDHRRLLQQWQRGGRGQQSSDEEEEDDDNDNDDGDDAAAAAESITEIAVVAVNRAAGAAVRTNGPQLRLELPAGCGLFGEVAKVASSGWGRGGWPHRGAWVSKKKSEAGFS